VKSVLIGYGTFLGFTAASYHIHPHGVPYWYFIGSILIFVVTFLCWEREDRGRGR